MVVIQVPMLVYPCTHHNTGPYVNFAHVGNSKLGQLPSAVRLLGLSSLEITGF